MADCSNSNENCQQRTGIIYKITNMLNGKVYLGQTIQKLCRRISQHKCSKKKGIDQAIKKYGWENFSHEVIEECPVEMLNEREIFWIKFYDCIAPNGYNLHAGGKNHNITAENRAKLSANSGHKISEETKAKLRAANLGKKASAETRAKMSAKRKGVPKTAEMKAKLSATNKARGIKPPGRKKHK